MNLKTVIRNGKKHSQFKVNSRRSQYTHVLFILFSFFSRGKFGKTLATCNVQKPSLFIFSFLTKDQKRKKNIKKKNSTHFSLI